MVIRHSDARRRRAVIEGAANHLENSAETLAEEVPASHELTAATAKTPRLYLAGAERRHQPKTTDWIPKRRLSVATFLGGMLAAFLLLTGLGYYSQISGTWNAGSFSGRRLSLIGTGSLSVWFSTVLLLASGLASLQIQALRQHRSNDYRGTYRIWLLFAGLLILASMNCVLDVDSAIEYLRGSQTNATRWIIPAIQLALLAAIFARGAVEVRRSPASIAMILFVWLSYSAATAMRIPGVELNMVQEHREFTAAGLNLFGHFGLFATITLYARFVYLRANGLVAQRVAESQVSRGPKRAAKSLAATAASLAGRNSVEKDGKPVRKPASATRTRNPRTVKVEKTETRAEPVAFETTNPSNERGTIEPEIDESVNPEFSPVDDAESTNSTIRPLSKAERKRMKKLQRQSQNRRAA